MGKKDSHQIDGKIVLLGAMGVGKTSLVEKFIFDVFQNPPNTIGAAYAEKKVKVEDTTVKLQVWDTGGQERYRAMAALYYRDSKAAIICYSLAHKNTLTDVKYWARQLQENEPNCRIFLCGTKQDLVEGSPHDTIVNNNVTSFQGDLLRKEPVQRGHIKSVMNDFGFGDEVLYQTSSKTGGGVSDLFMDVASYLATVTTKLSDSTDGREESQRLSDSVPKKHACKCS